MTYCELSLVPDELMTVQDFLASGVVQQPPHHFLQSAVLVIRHPLDSATAAATASETATATAAAAAAAAAAALPAVRCPRHTPTTRFCNSSSNNVSNSSNNSNSSSSSNISNSSSSNSSNNSSSSSSTSRSPLSSSYATHSILQRQQQQHQ